MENVIAIGVVQTPFLFLKESDKSFAKNADRIRKGCMLQILKIGSRFHQAYYNGKTVYAKAGSLNLIFKTSYSHDDFLEDLNKILHSKEPKLLLEKTVTLSVFHNSGHRLVTPLERYLSALGYYQGRIEEAEGGLPLFGEKLAAAVRNYQDFYLHLPYNQQNGALTAGGMTWKALIESSLH